MTTQDSKQILNELRELINADIGVFLATRLHEAGRYHSSVERVWEEVSRFVRRMGAQVSTLMAAASAGTGRVPDGATARLGTAVELYTYGILVHDDVLDRDQIRFGHPAFHCVFATEFVGGEEAPAEASHFGQSMALLGGALMQAIAVEATVDLPLPAPQTLALVHLLTAGYRRITESQVVDLVFEHRLPTPEEWHKMAGQRAGACQRL